MDNSANHLTSTFSNSSEQSMFIFQWYICSLLNRNIFIGRPIHPYAVVIIAGCIHRCSPRFLT